MTRYRTEIDGLRAIAVGSVILNHFDHGLAPSGYLGVDIFFVISGYVITLSLCSHGFGSLGDVLLGFYARRFKRLMPALIVCVMVTSVLFSLVDSAPSESLKTGAFAIFGLSNLYLLRISNDYFGGPSQLNAFTHTWSLGVEEQFYLVFPFLLWLLLRHRDRIGARAIHTIIAAIAVLSFALFVMAGVRQPMAAFYLMPPRFWELAAGCLVALVHVERGRAERGGPRWVQDGIVILLVAALFLPQRLAPFTSLAVVALASAALALLSPGSRAFRLLAGRAARYPGLLSYSLYLWHWPILVLGRFTIGVHLWSAPILVALILAVAHLSYHRIEKPLRSRAWAAGDGRTVLRGAGAAVSAAAFVAMLAVPLSGRLYAGRAAQLSARNVVSLSDAYRIPRTSFTWAGADCVLSDGSETGKDIPVDACTLGRRTQAQHRVLVIGNSFAAAFVHGFDALVTDDHYAVTITSSYGASPVSEVPNTSPWARTNSHYWRAVVPQMVSLLRPGDWVFMVDDLAGFAPHRTTAQNAHDLEVYRDGLLAFSERMARAGVRLAVLDANPLVEESFCKPETALPQWFAPGGGPCGFLTRAETIARRRPVDAMLRRLQDDHRLVLIDLFDLFCPGRTCTFQGRRHEVLYRDEFSHPSVEAVREAAPLVRRLLTSPPADGPGGHALADLLTLKE